MNVTTFKEKDFVTKRKSDATIRVTYNRLAISSLSVKIMGLKSTDRVLIHQDNNEPHIWYLTLNKAGFKIATVKTAPALYIYNTDLAQMILKSFGLKKNTDAFNFYLEEEPIEHKGVKYWKLVPEVE